MRRLTEAGLNPNLVYGNGAENTAQSIRSSSFDNTHMPAPKVDYFSAQGKLMEFMQMKLMQEQTNNIASQAALTNAQSKKTEVETQTAQLDYDQRFRSKDVTYEKGLYDLEQSKQSVEKTKADIIFTLDSNERQALANSYNIAKTVQEISLSKVHELEAYQKILTSTLERKKIEQEIQHLKAITQGQYSENQIKEADLKLKKQGLQPHDEIYWRQLYKLLVGDYDTSIIGKPKK